MSRAKLAAAKELIKEKKYEEARDLLRTIPDDPTAAKWIERINEIVGESVRPKAIARSMPHNYSIVTDEQSEQESYLHPLNRRVSPPPPPPRTTANVGMARFFRAVWGICLLFSVGWICLGLANVTNVAGDLIESNTSESYQAGVALGSGVGFTLYACTGLPLILLFGFLYWRNGIAIREEQRHQQTMEAMQGR